MITGEELAIDPETLHSAAVGGDEGARDALARLCLPRVRRLALLSVGVAADVDDLVQTAMARIFAHLDSYRGEALFLTWVDRVTANVVRDHYRRKRWAVFQLFDEKTPSDRQEEPERPDQELQRQRVLRQLATHFSRLRPRQRLPLVLSMVHGYTVPEIAQMLDLGTEATKKRILRGRRNLLRRVSRDPVCREAVKEYGR